MPAAALTSLFVRAPNEALGAARRSKPLVHVHHVLWCNRIMKNDPLLYSFQELAHRSAEPLVAAARAGAALWGSALNPLASTPLGRAMHAAADSTTHLFRRYGKPSWGVDGITVDGRQLPVLQTSAWRSPWCDLALFSATRPAGSLPVPKVLVVAPLSGHHATLLRGTVRTLLRDHDVYVTDWTNAREVPLTTGTFDFHDYIDLVRTMLQQVGDRPHVLAVCQPGPCVLAAAALMAEDGDPARPATMTFMGSPLDARRSPTVTNKLAEGQPFSWFERNMIQVVPPPYPGAGRRVYPGFVQLASFMMLNVDKHLDAHWRYFQSLVASDGDAAAKHREFYDEYLAVLDLTEEFYLQTVDIVFQRYLLARGELVHRGRIVRPECITDIGLHTVEGAEDDISGIGQTQAAHTMCSALPDPLRAHHVQPHVGHYGIFNGQRFETEIYPRVRDFIAALDGSRSQGR